MAIPVQRLKVLLAVSREGGIQAAADALKVSPSAVSQQMQKLEQESGFALLTRTQQGSQLTEQGKIMAAGAERIEGELERTHRELMAHAGTPTGVVRFGAFQTVIRGLILGNLEKFSHEAPGVDLHVREYEVADSLVALRRGMIDITVRESDDQMPEAPRGTEIMPLLQEPWYVVYSNKIAESADPRELATKTWLGCDPDSAVGRATARLARLWGIEPSEKYVYADYDVALSMVQAGLGVTVLPKLGLVDVPEGVEVSLVPGIGTRQLALCVSTAKSRQSDAVDLTCNVLRKLAQEQTQPAEG